MNHANFAPQYGAGLRRPPPAFIPRARVTVSYYEASGAKGKPFVIWLDELPAWMARSKGTLVYAVTAEGDL